MPPTSLYLQTEGMLARIFDKEEFEVFCAYQEIQGEADVARNYVAFRPGEEIDSLLNLYFGIGDPPFSDERIKNIGSNVCDILDDHFPKIVLPAPYTDHHLWYEWDGDPDYAFNIAVVPKFNEDI